MRHKSWHRTLSTQIGLQTIHIHECNRSDAKTTEYLPNPTHTRESMLACIKRFRHGSWDNSPPTRETALRGCTLDKSLAIARVELTALLA